MLNCVSVKSGKPAVSWSFRNSCRGLSQQSVLVGVWLACPLSSVSFFSSTWENGKLSAGQFRLTSSWLGSEQGVSDREALSLFDGICKSKISSAEFLTSQVQDLCHWPDAVTRSTISRHRYFGPKSLLEARSPSPEKHICLKPAPQLCDRLPTDKDEHFAVFGQNSSSPCWT